MPDFSHKGIAIELTCSGLFAATVNGKQVIKSSLKAMKDLIDTPPPFEPFDAFYEGRYNKLEKVRVIGIVKAKGTPDRYNCDRFCLEDRQEEPDAVVPIDGEAAYAEWLAYVEETRRIEKERQDRSHELRGKIALIKPPQR